MSVESTTTIAGLNALWPQGTDVKAEGDDHLRLIKSVLKADAVPLATLTQYTKATAQTRNRIINSAMQVSQENGNTAGTSDGYCPADQWYMYRVMGGTMTAQRVQVVTPNGSRNRLRITVTAADASLAAADYLEFYQPIEGTRVSEFGWGTAAARPVILRFGWKSPAGTFSIGINNGGFNRSYIANFTIAAGAANTDTVQTFVIPGDTTGTWSTDISLGMALGILIAAGTNTQGVAGWQAGGLTATSSNTNGMASVGAVFELFDVGLYLDPNATGVPPPWQMPDEAQELAACQRYWQLLELTMNAYSPAGAVNHMVTALFPVVMRTTPALAMIAAGSGSNVSSALYDLPSTRSARQGMASTATGHFSIAGRMYTANARM